MNIAFDVDGVLTDFEWFLDVYGIRYFGSKTKKKIEKKINSDSVADRFGFTKDWEKRFYRRYLPWYVRKYPIRENASEVLRTLRLQGNKVYIITARALAERPDVLGKLSRYLLIKWLKRNKVDYDGIYFVSNEDCSEEKFRLAKELMIDVFVEDNPQNIQRLNSICKVISVKADYNQDIPCFAHALDLVEVYWYINKDTDFEKLDFRERELLPEEQKIQYIEQLLKYYYALPFDEEFLTIVEKNIDKALFWIRRIFCLFFPFKIVKGAFPDSCHKVIFVCNHRSALDIPLCYVVLHPNKARILTKRELEFSILGNFMRWLGFFFVKREDKKSGKIVQKLMIQTLLHNGNILLFPEETRNKTENKLLPFKMGAVYMAQVTGAPIIPIIIERDIRHSYISIGEKMYVGILDNLESANERLHFLMEQMYDGMFG